ncbi:hypothetical protein [Nitrosospira sp. NpAV]|uniref:hypothetical protein n=1 Tax=Nitrosospira sp. NpAV TaxID=58133 RepID=UPI00059FB2ED|nr:hypothetical protein [Nitrosospira sp. NpAV]KIO49920.1 hypothetical protein SQ11_03140 [Nitrosospira sp. NpAV]
MVASQAASVVRYDGLAFRTQLHAERFVKLVAPIRMNEELTEFYEKVCHAETEEAWRKDVNGQKKLLWPLA